ncbi:helix-turn-helix transcriptional regulator [Paenibacillus selenitireducens]|nr:AraC family transcriptional regulator [Paenibacillus selenitireducens]
MADQILMIQPVIIGTSSDHHNQYTYHTHSHYEIYYFRGGKCTYLINDQIYIMEPGDLLLMHGMTLHRPHIDPVEPYIRTTIHFDPVFLQSFMHAPLKVNVLEPFQKLQNIRLQLRDETKQEVEASIDRIQQLYDLGDVVSIQRSHVLLLDLLLQIHNLCSTPLQAKTVLPSARAEHVQRIITFIEQHYAEEITLERLESELHLSKYYLAKIFKEITGLTIFYYLMQRRVKQAKVELMGGVRPITDIGYEVGFKYPSHFSRAFKQHAGVTPEQYRKKNLFPSSSS